MSNQTLGTSEYAYQFEKYIDRLELPKYSPENHREVKQKLMKWFFGLSPLEAMVVMAICNHKLEKQLLYEKMIWVGMDYARLHNKV